MIPAHVIIFYLNVVIILPGLQMVTGFAIFF
uniref:Uncharacterized protein n=1 Tax=uncultured bacterium BLR19 TaxID=506519 RepID=C0INZ4_9BACT|nr:hypothetical protein AKSOIL_0322 [uncultured bacterium BLR19]